MIVKKQTFYGAYFAIARHQNKSCQVGLDLILAFMKELLFYSHAFITSIVLTPLRRKPLQFTKYALLSDFQKNYAKLFFSSATVKRTLLNCIPAQDGIVAK